MCYHMSDAAKYLKSHHEYGPGKDINSFVAVHLMHVTSSYVCTYVTGTRVMLHDLEYQEVLAAAEPVISVDLVLHRCVIYLNNCQLDFSTVSVASLHNISFSLLYRVLSTTICGMTYVIGEVVVCAIEDDMPVFGKIVEFIVTPRQECLFIISSFITVCFHYHYHAFKVVAMQDTVGFHYEELCDYHPLVCTKLSGTCMFISLKYHVF